MPAELRRRLGLNPGARLGVTEEPDGLRLRLERAVPATKVAELAGMVTAPSRGKPRKLADFGPACSPPRPSDRDLRQALVRRAAKASLAVPVELA